MQASWPLSRSMLSGSASQKIASQSLATIGSLRRKMSRPSTPSTPARWPTTGTKLTSSTFSLKRRRSQTTHSLPMTPSTGPTTSRSSTRRSRACLTALGGCGRTNNSAIARSGARMGSARLTRSRAFSATAGLWSLPQPSPKSKSASSASFSTIKLTH